ncbi:MAG TPA: hypothetical protein PKA13_19490 [Geminicoccaceae bacterium]|nr:hypothetical protein [Geminicoccus sp.]HMU51969.1 hypothetical protein [Geminicoccaceae bacterium]
MLTPESDDGDDGDIVFRDLIMLMLSGFVTVAVLLLSHINAPSARTSEGMEPPGNVVIEARWPDGMDADIDLWVQGPGDVPVGYSNKGGELFNLLRDDLGKYADATDLNYEVAYSRGVAGGEYTVNAHLYRDNAAVYPVPVTVVVSTKRATGGSSRQILKATVELAREGQELTVFRFRLDAKGELEPGSVHALQKNLRSARPA